MLSQKIGELKSEIRDEDRVDEPDAAQIPGLGEAVLEGSQGMSAPGWLIEAKGAVMTVVTVQEVHSEHPAAQPVQCDRQFF
jgi:hypothetical protein